MSPAYIYVLNQYILGKFTETDLETLVSRGIITEEERLAIIG